MKIDVHNHVMSEKMARLLERRSQYPYTKLVDGTYNFHCCKGLTMAMSPAGQDMRRKLEDMDAAGIDVAVLGLAVPGPELLGGKQAEDAARMVNDQMAEIVAANPRRFWAYATLGFGNIEASLKELDRCISTLKFRSLQMFSNLNGRPLDAAEFRPVFARMAELKRPIFIHPTVPLNQNYMMDLVPAPALAFMVDSTLAAMRLALSGVLSQYADAPIIIPHVGATVPYLMSRLDSIMEHFGDASATREPSLLLKKLYMDIVAFRPEPLKWCFSVMGARQLLLGTDHPFGSWRTPARLLDEMECTDEERELMLHGNAERLFPA